MSNKNAKIKKIGYDFVPGSDCIAPAGTDLAKRNPCLLIIDTNYIPIAIGKAPAFIVS
jgi:hypothetical protein